jgi:endonuclease-3
MNLEERAKKIMGILEKAYPGAKTALHHGSALQLLIATILSAQCTDSQVNKVTPALFKKFKTAGDFANADKSTLELMIKSTGFYKNKAASIQKCCAKLDSDFGGRVPKTIEELTSLPGVGRKTANAVLGNYFGIPGIVVDTHVIRISRRLKLTKNEDPVKIEMDLQPLIPKKNWTKFSCLIQTHGRQCCTARKPNCSGCPIGSLCPSNGKV